MVAAAGKFLKLRPLKPFKSLISMPNDKSSEYVSTFLETRETEEKNVF